MNAEPTSNASSVPVALPRLLASAAFALYAAGFAAGFLQAHLQLAAGLRVAALALALPYAWRRRSLLLWTFLAMFVGAELGLDLPAVATQTRFLADIFLRLVRMIVAPLIFGGIVTGIAGHGELRGVGRVAVKAILFFEVVTTIGLILGAVAINLTQAGAGVVLPVAMQSVPTAAHPETWQQILVNIFPENIAQAVAQNQILQVAVFALLFGAALAQLKEEKRAPLVSVLQSLTETIFRMTRFIMLAAPLAAGAAMACTVGGMGVATLLPLLKLAATCYVTLIIFVLAVFVPCLLLARVPLGKFALLVAEPAALGFATTSSEAALPLAMERMELLGVPRWIVSFVIPTGYSFNLTGSTLYLSMAALFAAQAGGLHLTVVQQIVLLATLALSSKGIAGVPRATLVVLLGVAGSFQIPAAAVLMLLGVDTLMDMGRTGLNVLGNCMAAAVVARWEGEPLTPPVTTESF
ncbi:dicarboxylate/amino acid:cation symporter [Telmatobacter bradus]|uniref:dicarboxylate/amino acid:cation symporter n=1 Tax=Telmatobacter bradus TaxID=474953 RepID=UPI003B42DFA5